MTTQGPVTVIVAPRDTFTRLFDCLNNVLKHSDHPIEVFCLAGGAPRAIRERLEATFSARGVTFIFRDEFMTNAELRNIGLARARTPLAVCLDSDVFVRPGWLKPLLQCYEETGASLITPIVLDRRGLIHTAGNSFYITTDSSGKRYGMAELRYANLPYAKGSNIPRQETDFAEVHCHFLEVRTALELGIYDERMREGHEFDSAMKLRAAGKRMMLEPRSLVYLHYPPLQDRLEDIPLYRWKWDVNAVMDGFEYFEEKWGIDMLTKSNMRNHILMLNHRVGFCTQLAPSRASIAVDKAYFNAKNTMQDSMTLWRKLKNRIKYAGGPKSV